MGPPAKLGCCCYHGEWRQVHWRVYDQATQRVTSVIPDKLYPRIAVAVVDKTSAVCNERPRWVFSELQLPHPWPLKGHKRGWRSLLPQGLVQERYLRSRRRRRSQRHRRHHSLRHRRHRSQRHRRRRSQRHRRRRSQRHRGAATRSFSLFDRRRHQL